MGAKLLAGVAVLALVLAWMGHAQAQAVPGQRADDRRPDLVEGILEVVHEDSADGASLRRYVRAGGRSIALEAGADLPGLLTGASVRARGTREDALTLALDGSSGSVVMLAPAPLPNTSGDQRTLVLLVTFQDNTSTPYTIADADRAVFETADAYLREVSYGRTWLTGDVFGWFTLPLASTPCDPDQIAVRAKAAATAVGVDVGAYTRFVYMFPEVACPWWGRGSVGGSPSNVWVNGHLDYRVVSHELGHNLGFFHAHSLTCGATSITPPCTAADYGDKLDMMGGSWGHVNAFFKERAGWIGATNQPAVTTVTASGTFWIEPASSPSVGGAKALKVLKSVDSTTGEPTFYYVEARQATGFDAFISGSTNVLGGVVVHTGTGANGNSSYLIDMTPENTVWNDAALAVGKTFVDSTAGVAISTLSVGSGGASIAVTLTPLPPPLSTEPAITATVGQAAYTRGQTVTVAASLQLGTAAAPGVNVTFKFTKPKGGSVTGSATTDGLGVARFSLGLKKSDPIGTYTMTATATVGKTVSSTTSFVVR